MTGARSRRLRTRIIALLMLGLGVFVLIYPVVATLYNNERQREFASQYNQDVQQADPEQLSAALASAHAYNESFEPVPILDPWLSMATSDPTSDAYAQYAAQLADFDAMARIRVPSVGIDLPIYHGTTEAVLASGAGHLYGTSLPVGGDGTHAVITSHTGFRSATLFDHLDDVETGDYMFVDVLGETLAYQVDSIEVVLPTEISSLAALPGEDLLTLFTCTPYAVNSHRLLVHGHAVPYTPELEEASEADAPGFALEGWKYLLIGGSLAAVGAFGVLLIVDRRRGSSRA